MERTKLSKEKERIVFYGSTDFSVATLVAIEENCRKYGYIISAIVTIPDRYVRIRGKETLLSNPVKDYAILNGIELLQPEKPIDVLERIKEINPSIQFVVAYKILPPEIWSIPTHETINLHPSDLPLCKGPAPIPWSIAKGLDKARITAFIINERIDDGYYVYKSSCINIVDKRGIPKTANKIYHELMNRQVKQTIDALFGILDSDGHFRNGAIDEDPWGDEKNLMGIFDQDLYYAPKLTKENTKITKKALDFGERLQRFINGMYWKDHNAWTIVDNKEVKFIEAGVSIPGFIGYEPGELIVKQKVVYIVTNTLAGVELLTVKPEGKREMPAIDWINGVRNRRIDYGTVL